jgi:hypothetical protein
LQADHTQAAILKRCQKKVLVLKVSGKYTDFIKMYDVYNYINFKINAPQAQNSKNNGCSSFRLEQGILLRRKTFCVC